MFKQILPIPPKFILQQNQNQPIIEEDFDDIKSLPTAFRQWQVYYKIINRNIKI